MRVLVRVPEAYLLLEPFEAVRPGLLVLDADGRRVTCVPLTGTPKAVEVARLLREAVTSPGIERFVFRGEAKGIERLAARLKAVAGVAAAQTKSDGTLEVRAKAGTLDPNRLRSEVEAAQAKVETVEPAAVTVEAGKKGGSVAEPLSRVAGVWYVEGAGPVEALATSWLLHPSAFEAEGLSTDLVAEIFPFDKLPKGGSAVKLLRLPFEVAGVLAVVPRVFEDRIEVVARRGVFDRAALTTAFQKAGLVAATAAK